LQDPEPEVDDGAPLAPIYQTTTRTSEIRLSVEEFKDRAADLALYSYTVHHDLAQAAIADLLKLNTSAAKYRSPYLMEQFIDASVNLGTRAVDCCVNGCLAFTFKRAQQTACDACGAPRFKSDGKPARQVTYWSLASWLAHLFGDPVIGKSMLENMEKARLAADEDVGSAGYTTTSTRRSSVSYGTEGYSAAPSCRSIWAPMAFNFGGRTGLKAARLLPPRLV